jgi:hypothetical protein
VINPTGPSSTCQALIASISSLGKENMRKLQETKRKDSTVLLEKENGKITVKTPKEISEEKARTQQQTQTRV